MTHLIGLNRHLYKCGAAAEDVVGDKAHHVRLVAAVAVTRNASLCRVGVEFRMRHTFAAARDRARVCVQQQREPTDGMYGKEGQWGALKWVDVRYN